MRAVCPSCGSAKCERTPQGFQCMRCKAWGRVSSFTRGGPQPSLLFPSRRPALIEDESTFRLPTPGPLEELDFD